MGFRYRKSINLGGGFRLNLSKSGVGYSYGGKGYRFTKKANGGTRSTFSLPGTGLSYVKETGGKKRRKNPGNYAHNGVDPSQFSNPSFAAYDIREIRNADIDDMVSSGSGEMLNKAENTLFYCKLSILGFWLSLLVGFAYHLLWIVTAASLAGYILLKTRSIINLKYPNDGVLSVETAKRLIPFEKIANCNMLWSLSQTSKTAGQNSSVVPTCQVRRSQCFAALSIPFPFKTNTTVVCFDMGKEKLVFLPDKLIVFQNGKIAVFDYSCITFEAYNQQYAELETVPQDAKIVASTWQYTTKSWDPDKRYQNNQQIPICLYGTLVIKSTFGLHTEIMYSNPDVLN